MSRPYDLWTLRSLILHLEKGPQAFTEVRGLWLPAKPLPYRSIWNRLKLAWLVFRYKADAFTWDMEREGGPGRSGT